MSDNSSIAISRIRFLADAGEGEFGTLVVEFVKPTLTYDADMMPYGRGYADTYAYYNFDPDDWRRFDGLYDPETFEAYEGAGEVFNSVVYDAYDEYRLLDRDEAEEADPFGFDADDPDAPMPAL